MSYKIMLDAGHYGKRNRSPVVPEYYESVQMWKLCNYLKLSLTEYGFDVGVTRTDPDKDMAVYERGRASKGYDLFLSLHSNAAADNSGSAADRVCVYAAYDNLNDSWKLGSSLAYAVADVMGISERYVKTRKSEKGDYEYYGVMRGARSVGCPLYYIAEHSFHTNPYAASWLMNDTNLQKLAAAEAKAVAKYFGLPSKGDVNGNGKIDSNDYLLVKRFILGTYDLSDDEKARADYNSDGKINAADYNLIKRTVLGTYKPEKE